MTPTNKKLLALLKQNARLSNAELSTMLGISEQEVAAGIKELEASGIIIGYAAIVNEEKADDNAVTAIIELKVTPFKDRGFDDLAHTIMQYEEVDSVFLLSGANDLSITITGTSLRKVALFVSERLAVLDGVLSTTTHFVLRRYKEKNHVFSEEHSDEGVFSRRAFVNSSTSLSRWRELSPCPSANRTSRPRGLQEKPL